MGSNLRVRDMLKALQSSLNSVAFSLTTPEWNKAVFLYLEIPSSAQDCISVQCQAFEWLLNVRAVLQWKKCEYPWAEAELNKTLEDKGNKGWLIQQPVTADVTQADASKLEQSRIMLTSFWWYLASITHSSK